MDRGLRWGLLTGDSCGTAPDSHRVPCAAGRDRSSAPSRPDRPAGSPPCRSMPSTPARRPAVLARRRPPPPTRRRRTRGADHDRARTVAPAFVDMAHSIVWATVATVSPEGRPHTRILHPIWEWDGTDLRGWILTSPRSPKAVDLAANPIVSLTYWNPAQDTATVDAGHRVGGLRRAAAGGLGPLRQRSRAGGLRPVDHPVLARSGGTGVRRAPPRADEGPGHAGHGDDEGRGHRDHVAGLTATSSRLAPLQSEPCPRDRPRCSSSTPATARGSRRPPSG